MSDLTKNSKSFCVFDSDSHVVEPRAIWDTYLDPEYRTLGKFALWREEGKTNSYLKINGKVFRDSMNTNIPRHAIWQPGMSWEDVGELDPTVRHPQSAGAVTRQPACAIWMPWVLTKPCSTPPGLPRVST